MPQYRRCRPEDSAIPTALRAQENKVRKCTRQLPVHPDRRLVPAGETGRVAPKVLREPWRALTLAMESQRVGRVTAAAAAGAPGYRRVVLDRSRWWTAGQNHSRLTKA